MWLWVFTSATTTVFTIGARSKAVLIRLLGPLFNGWLISDGYWAYRDLDNRLRCLAHLQCKACGLHVDAAHEKTRALARELLKDFDTFWVTLDHPELPLTNNDAERALRHWVIARRISQGTRTAQGSKTVAVLASVIETCRKRDLSPWNFITEAVTERRRAQPAPQLPAAA